MSDHWSIAEVEAIVADYFSMLALELRSELYNKAAHRRNIKPLLKGRSDPSIERKHQNISAILNEIHFPWIVGYKPLGNYQRLLSELVLERLATAHELRELARQSVDSVVALPPSPLHIEPEDPPEVEDPGLYLRERSERPSELYRARNVDYFLREAHNRSLGSAGEEFVVELERDRLTRAGEVNLADRVEWSSRERGDGIGYDILSFEPTGRERFIEVKTTSFGKETPFFVTRNEVGFSSDFEDQYRLYRLFTFRIRPRIYTLSGALERTCRLEANAFIAHVR
ncbi:MAG TPA: DUF3883 domain-containing protein [Thermoanaerobaculia bacterium]|nr:DUF3883 domain-containing protein [Thermoanaerobaculia bacterium]